jgi:hypothetical protein
VKGTCGSSRNWTGWLRCIKGGRLPLVASSPLVVFFTGFDVHGKRFWGQAVLPLKQRDVYQHCLLGFHFPLPVSIKTLKAR